MEPNPIGLGELRCVEEPTVRLLVSMEPNPIGLGEDVTSHGGPSPDPSLNGAESDRTRRVNKLAGVVAQLAQSQWSRIRSDSESGVTKLIERKP